MSPMRRDLYPDDWREIAAFVKAANDYECMGCGKQCTRPGEPYSGAANVLTVAHITQDYYAAEVQVAPLCSVCHLRFDSIYSGQARRRLRQLRQRAAGQLLLLRQHLPTASREDIAELDDGADWRYLERLEA